MSVLRHRSLATLVRIYEGVILIVAVVLSPLSSSFVPILVLLWHVIQWRRRMAGPAGLLSEWFVYTAAALLFSRTFGPVWSALLPLPALFLVIAKLEENALVFTSSGHGSWQGGRRLAGASLGFALLAAVVFIIALLVGSPSLAVAGLIPMATVAGLGVAAWRSAAQMPVVEVPVTQRMVAGSKVSLDMEFKVRTRTGGRLFLDSPGEWVRLDPAVLSLDGDRVITTATLSPSLSGPTALRLKARTVDRWGLVETSFELEPLQLYVIPRARYAAWLVERYMAGTGAGTLPLLTNVGMIKPLHGWRRGVEYYGSRLYQPGDSLKNIDWKHSLQHRELTAKEFAEFGGRPAIVLVDLVAGDAEEADRLAYAIISTALSLARENVPAAMAAYAQGRVRFTTGSLGPEKLLAAALQTARQLVTVAKPARYLSPPNVTRLRGNIRRLASVQSQAAAVLTALLKVEYDALSQASLKSAASMALEQVMRKADRDSNIIVVSSPSGDTDALQFSAYSLRQRGNHVIDVSV